VDLIGLLITGPTSVTCSGI